MNQADVKFSYKKYYAFRNKIHTTFGARFYSDMALDNVMRALTYGDTQPAVVLSASPLVIAAYSDEMDAVVLLSYPEEFAQLYSLSAGSRLTVSATYAYGDAVVPDIFPGEDFSWKFVDFMPLVQLFLGKKDEKIREKTALFGEDVWEKVTSLGEKYLAEHSDLIRDGFYYLKKKKKK